VSYQRRGPALRIDSTVGIHVYRVLQEALNNVARHSGGRRAWVRLHVYADRLELEIEDHGKGMGNGASHRGLGVTAMRERAAIVGGSIGFESPRDGGPGTLVHLSVPLGGMREPRVRESASAHVG
jgi:signal transduction histidine kinase